MNQIKECFTKFIGKTKNKFLNIINTSKMLEQEFKWNLINFIITCVTLIAAITSIVTTTSSTDKSVTIGLVYGFYLPFALANCILSVIVAGCYIKKDIKSFWKQWFYYMPLTIILIDAIILPIPLNLITWATVNGGMMWTIIIFAFLSVFAAFATFIWVYKSTLNDQSYVLNNETDESKLNDFENSEAKSKDNNKTVTAEYTKKDDYIETIEQNKEDINNQLVDEAKTLPFITEIKNDDHDLAISNNDEIKKIEENNTDKNEHNHSSFDDNDSGIEKSNDYNNDTF